MTVFMSLWTVYDHPRDVPDKFVARRWDILRGAVEPQPSNIHITADSLEEIRKHFLERGLACLGRAEGDDACIVETWL